MSPRRPQSLWAVPWPPRAAIRPEVQGRAGAWLCFPTLNPFVPFPWAWPRPTPQTALHTADRLPLGLSRAPAGTAGVLPWRWEFRPVSWAWEGQQNHCHNSLSSLQTLRATDTLLEKVVRSCSATRVSEQLQSIFQVWHVKGGGFSGAVPHPGGKGVSTLECMVLTPVPCRESTLQGGCPPPLVTRGCPAGSSGAQCPQRVASAFARPQSWPGGICPKPARDPRGRNPAKGFARDPRQP